MILDVMKRKHIVYHLIKYEYIFPARERYLWEFLISARINYSVKDIIYCDLRRRSPFVILPQAVKCLGLALNFFRINILTLISHIL